MTRPGWRDVLFEVVAVAAFARLAPTAWARRGPRAVAAWIAFSTAAGFAVRTWFVPWCERMTEMKEELRGQFGREPTDTEVMEHVRAASGR
jgi:CBS domain containing-hemolysin-like protein